MKHCYVFDYANCKILHIEILPEFTNEDIYNYLFINYGLKESNIHFMTSYEELEITNI